MLETLVACIPILSFGLLPVVATRIGGRPVEQSLGVALGSLLFAILVFVIKQPSMTVSIFLISLCSGMFWAIGSIGQFKGLHYLGVSKSMPISNGGQIIGTSLMGIVLGDWITSTSKTYGFIALAFIIVGIIFTSYKEPSQDKKLKWKEGIFINLLSVLGFTFYVGILKYFKIDGWSCILPQSIGQIIGILLIAFVFLGKNPISSVAFKNSLGGVIWAIGNIALLISQEKIELAVAYPVSQAAVIVSILGGVFINNERKTTKEWFSTVIGMLVIIGGLYMIYLSSLYKH